MSMIRKGAVALAAVGLAATGASAASATTASAGAVVVPSTTSLSTACYSEYAAVTPTRLLVKNLLQGPSNTRAVISVPISFVPRLMSYKGYYQSTVSGRGVINEEYFAVRPLDSSLWRITWTYTYDKKINQVAYHRASTAGWGSVRALTVSGGRLYYIDGAATLRRAAISSSGDVSTGSQVMRTGLWSTKFLKSSGTGYTTVNGVRTASWDMIMAATTDGRLYQHRYVYAGSGSNAVLQLAASGWNRFSGIVVGDCGGTTAVYTGRDARTTRLDSYYDANALTTGDGLAWKGTPGNMPWYVYG